ncbi:MAG TPA: hypothetical protein VMT62_17445 [Syntrophorhabdaceae bacterium]|nr:hypothetical protein [Syntrophorhabdaceae bacterium]
MDEMFIRKVRAAAVAGWWTVLIAYCILLFQWLAYIVIMARQPAQMQCLWGLGASWPEIRTIWLWAMVAFKFLIGTTLFVTLWLTLWARQLAKRLNR